MTPEEMVTALDKRLRDVENQLEVAGLGFVHATEDRLKALELHAESWLSKEGRLLVSWFKANWETPVGFVIGLTIGYFVKAPWHWF